MKGVGSWRRRLLVSTAMNSALSIDPSNCNEARDKAYEILKLVDLSIYVQYILILLGSEIRDLSATEAIICGYKIGSSRNLIYGILNKSTAAD